MTTSPYTERGTRLVLFSNSIPAGLQAQPFWRHFGADFTLRMNVTTALIEALCAPHGGATAAFAIAGEEIQAENENLKPLDHFLGRFENLSNTGLNRGLPEPKTKSFPVVIQDGAGHFRPLTESAASESRAMRPPERGRVAPPQRRWTLALACFDSSKRTGQVLQHQSLSVTQGWVSLEILASELCQSFVLEAPTVWMTGTKPHVSSRLEESFRSSGARGMVFTLPTMGNGSATFPSLGTRELLLFMAEAPPKSVFLDLSNFPTLYAVVK